jgi:hypothetical protein
MATWGRRSGTDAQLAARTPSTIEAGQTERLAFRLSRCAELGHGYMTGRSEVVRDQRKPAWRPVLAGVRLDPLGKISAEECAE